MLPKGKFKNILVNKADVRWTSSRFYDEVIFDLIGVSVDFKVDFWVKFSIEDRFGFLDISYLLRWIVSVE